MRGRPRKNSIPFDKYDDVVNYYTVLNKSIQEIADVFNVTTYIVRGVLFDKGVQIKPRGRFKDNVKMVLVTAPLGDKNNGA